MIGLTRLNLSLRAQRGNLVARASTQLRKSYRDSVALRDVVGRGLGRPIGRTQTRNVSDGMTSESGFAGFKDWVVRQVRHGWENRPILKILKSRTS